MVSSLRVAPTVFLRRRGASVRRRVNRGRRRPKAAYRGSSSEIKREMELISHIEASVQTVRVIVGIVVFFCPVFMTAWLRSHFCGDRCENILASIPQWASLLLLIAFTFGSILLAVAVSDLQFWKRYLDVLRRKRMQSFWEWRSATLRFPTGHTMYSSDFDRSELPGPSEFKDKPP